ncbi:MAG: hypothetical protein AVDCRST_MAG19-2437 [uncultured Thermomicrobiales bacterium]|uniref:Peptidase S8/S53 domain-containing protein n=1 Tax=uncultured Thermomicrobiales bacterium TaxID=1645740 RepID=A0A6J4V5A4_9BACT|nr:MAG: hypothetical protein AVDCRST_MAG19-2437 [uncultured Thermomicrobiales bacterium]
MLARLTLLVAVSTGSVAAGIAPDVAAVESSEPRDRQSTGRPVEGRYIVVLRDDVADPRGVAAGLGRDLGLSVSHVYDTVLNGFAARVPAQALDGLRRNPRVAAVEEDRTVAATAALPTGVDRVGAEDAGGAGAGPGVPVAILDSGIAEHPDLTIAGGYNCTSDDRTAYDDVHGHGTHVAGTVGASGGSLGVAPGTPLYAVKVLGDDGIGRLSWVICGLDWAPGQGITVANLSLVGASSEDPTACESSSLHRAVCKAAASGLRLVVAAGNDGGNTAGYAPAKYDQVTTVSALADADGCRGGRGGATGAGPDDTRATFSNRGTAVDVAAPGVGIASTWLGGGYRTLNGTSMAAPHVAALVALGGYAKEASGFREPIAILPNGDTRCEGDTDANATGTLDDGAVAAAAPRAGDDAYRVDEDRVLRRAAPGVLANDSGDAGPLTVRVENRPRTGRLTLNPNGSFAYEPERDFSGSVSFTYRVKDAAGRSDVGRVTIRVVSRRN